MDFISISTYYRLVWNKNAIIPTYNETVGKLSYRAKKITRWRQAANLTHMKILVAEFGYQSKGGLVNYYLPWDWEATGKVDKQAQVCLHNYQCKLLFIYLFIYFHSTCFKNGKRTNYLIVFMTFVNAMSR